MRTLPEDWLTAMATARVFLEMAAAAQWRVPSPLDRVMPSAGRVDVHAGRLGDAITVDQDGPFQLGDVLDLLSNAPVANVALLPAVPAEGIEIERLAHRHHLFGVADDEHGADGLALPALPADFSRQVNHGPEHLQRYVEYPACGRSWAESRSRCSPR